MKTWLMDTGPFVAYLNRTDPMHESVVERFDEFAGQLVTTSAVVTEVMYFLSDAPTGRSPSPRCWSRRRSTSPSPRSRLASSQPHA